MGLGSEFPERQTGWGLTLYPEAGEAGGRFYSGAEPSKAKAGRSDPERSAVEAARRARGKVRRYCAANRLNRLGTLTYAGEGCHDPIVIRGDMAEFFRKLRSVLGGDPLPYLWVPEWHKTDHGLHAHFALGQFVQRQCIEDAWGRGFVHIKLLGDLPVGSGALDEARVAARYLSKYVGKAFDERRLPARHRYEVGQGFQPAGVRIFGTSLGRAVHHAVEVMGKPPSRTWHSNEVKEWGGPPAIHMTWSS
jgi:hypothetical protein